MKTIKLPKAKCQRCGHIWIPKKEIVRVCPKCHSAWWDENRSNNKK